VVALPGEIKVRTFMRWLQIRVVSTGSAVLGPEGISASIGSDDYWNIGAVNPNR
jgi:hypothetical protein